MSEEQSERKRKVPTWLVCVFALVVAVLAVGFLIPIFVSSQKKTSHARAVQDVKKIGYALYEFEEDYGMYPNEETARLLKEKYPTRAHLLKTKTSNDLLKQLVIAGYMGGDSYLYGDDQLSAMEWLNSDVFPYSYVMGMSSSSNSALPLLICPLERGKTTVDEKYSRKHHNQRVVIIRVDLSVTDRRLDDDYFDWSQPHWGSQKPKILWPK